MFKFLHTDFPSLQVVDMRWGVRNEATVDHSAGELCMSEIESCKQYSVGPTFVVRILK